VHHSFLDFLAYFSSRINQLLSLSHNQYASPNFQAHKKKNVHGKENEAHSKSLKKEQTRSELIWKIKYEKKVGYKKIIS
jgi:hypothetical protein